MKDSCYLIPKSKGGGGNALSAPRRGLRRLTPLGVEVKPAIPVTLVCVDTTDRVDLAARAVAQCVSQATFADVKLLTHETAWPNSVKIRKLDGIPDYSNFMVRELSNYVHTSHCLVVQWDGYVVDGTRWLPEFLNFDYIGAPWWQWQGLVGNGGFSLRSKRLLETLSKTDFGDQPHPEDNYICFRHRQDLQARHRMRFAPTQLADRFAIEARTYDGKGWQGSDRFWNDHFGFHSYLTPLPEDMDRPLIFNHGGDFGDVIYSLPVIKSLGGGVLFLSPDNRYPYPRKPHGSIDAAWVNNIAPLLNIQPYIWQTLSTGTLPYSTDYDLNAFREFYKTSNPENWRSILQLHLRRFGVEYDETKPWLTVDKAVTVPGRPIVVNRTARYQNDSFPWGDLVQRYGEQMVFLGSDQEWENFKGFSPHKPVPRVATNTLLDVARVIAGAKVFVGNQSSALSIAHGLGKPVVVECWLANDNCRLSRANTVYWRQGGTPWIPDEWLK